MSRVWFLVLVVLVSATVLGSASAAVAAEGAASRVKVVAKTSPVSPGEYASIKVRVRPRSVVCRIGVFYKTTKSEAKGLGPRRPKAGTVTWRWRVGTNTTPGRWSIQIDCGKAGKAKVRIRVRR